MKYIRELNKKLNKKKKEQSKLKIEDQANYADSNRNIAVAMDSRDLAKALKSFKKEVVRIFQSDYWDTRSVPCLPLGL